MAFNPLGPARIGLGGAGIRAGSETGRARLSRAIICSMTSPIRLAPLGRAAATRSAIKSWSPWSLTSASPSGSFLSISIAPESLRRLVTRAFLRANRASRCRIIYSVQGSGWMLLHAVPLPTHGDRRRGCLDSGDHQAGRRAGTACHRRDKVLAFLAPLCTPENKYSKCNHS